MRNPVVLALLLIPAIFAPTCYGTYRLLLGGKDAVRGEVRTDFPVLIAENGSVDIVPYSSNLWKGATLVVPESDRASLRRRTLALTKTRMQRHPDDHIMASAEAGAMRNGVQRIHVEVHRSGAMGTRLSESWYDTDGVRVMPRFEREYAPSWIVTEAVVIAGPVSVLLAALLAGRLRRRLSRSAPAQPSS